MRDGFKIQILADGATKVTSEGFSGEKHLQAEEFRAWIEKKLGGGSTTVRNTEAHVDADALDHDALHALGLDHEHE